MTRRARTRTLTLAFLLSLFVAPAISDALSTVRRERYHEQLTIRPLHDGKVVTAFTFTTLLDGASPRDPRNLEHSAQHYTLFPLSLGQLLREYAVTELDLSLNAGKWNYDSWGYPDHHPSVGTGAELWAWMADGGPLSIDERWIGLRNALAGLFCASLGSLDDRRTASPASAFPLSSVPANRDAKTPYALRYATLPSEHVCTENLTPFLKLLPCKSHAGLARLLNPQHMFDADWHGLWVHVRSARAGIELRLGVQAVLDPVRRSGGKRRDWSFQSLFGRQIDASCPVASSSVIQLVVPDVDGFKLSPEPSSRNDTVSVYNLASHVPLDITMTWPEEHTFQYQVPPPPKTPLSIKRTLYGSSQTRGVLFVSLTNNDHASITVGYLETLPALVTLWMHTMQVNVGGIVRDDLVSNMVYHPPLVLANRHQGPSTLEATLTIPAKCTLRLSIELSKTFLKYTEHPPDAMRGWDLPPAVLFPVVVRDGDGVSTNRTLGEQRSIPRRMYTPTLLVDLPTPDFSMPYNVIILSCTLVTLIFGSMFNLLTRKWIIVKVED